ncbi:MAG: transcription/translation regulatory transformer protein RfaH [Polaromonas sp.]|nr:transcription/translation regulatory transformer protein RfaH [Polaromonas sp.]
MFNWYLVYSKPRQELCSLENLERQGFECFLPLISVEKLRRKVIVVVQEPLFPRYLFIRLDASQEGRSWNPIRSTTGVSLLVTFGQVPAKVDDQLVEIIRSTVSDASVRQRHFEPGELVRINDGPFAGLEAVYQMPDGEARVMVLIDILSKKVSLSIEPPSLSKIG